MSVFKWEIHFCFFDESKSIERTSSTIDPPHKFTFVGRWRELNARRNTALSSQRAEEEDLSFLIFHRATASAFFFILGTNLSLFSRGSASN